MRALGESGGTVGNGADKMDLVHMMLDCAETMTSVLDDVTDMGKFVDFCRCLILVHYVFVFEVYGLYCLT